MLKESDKGDYQEKLQAATNQQLTEEIELFYWLSNDESAIVYTIGLTAKEVLRRNDHTQRS